MKRSLFLVAALVSCGSSALAFEAGCNSCNKTAPDAPTDASDADAASPAPEAGTASKTQRDGGAGRVPWAAIPSATALIRPNMGFPDRFEAEQKARPANLKPNVEAVFAALEQAGLTVVDKKQHLGQTFGARYCVGARIVATDRALLQLSVCEFISDEVATMSRDYSTESLKMIPNRAIHAHKQTTLTIRDEAPVTPEIEAAAAKAFATYDAL